MITAVFFMKTLFFSFSYNFDCFYDKYVLCKVSPFIPVFNLKIIN